MLNICMGKISQFEKYFPKWLCKERAILMLVVYMKGLLPASDSKNKQWYVHAFAYLCLDYCMQDGLDQCPQHPGQSYSPLQLNVKQSLLNTIPV